MQESETERIMPGRRRNLSGKSTPSLEEVVPESHVAKLRRQLLERERKKVKERYPGMISRENLPFRRRLKLGLKKTKTKNSNTDTTYRMAGIW
jgi:hypothetical protein